MLPQVAKKTDHLVAILLPPVNGQQVRPEKKFVPAKKKIQEDEDYVLAPAPVWEHLHLWYGGGPVLKRYVFEEGEKKEKKIELHPLRMLVRSQKSKEQKTFFVGKYVTVETLKIALADKLGFDAVKSRLWAKNPDPDYGKQLLKRTKRSMEDSALAEDTEITIELPGRDGWNRAAAPRRNGSTISGALKRFFTGTAPRPSTLEDSDTDSSDDQTSDSDSQLAIVPKGP